MAFEEINNGDYENDPSSGSIFEAFEKVNRNLQKTVEKVTGKDLSTEDFTTALKSKLDDIAPNATANMTPLEIQAAYEALNDVNRYTDFDKNKLSTLVNENLDSASIVGSNLVMGMTSGTQIIVDMTPFTPPAPIGVVTHVVATVSATTTINVAAAGAYTLNLDKNTTLAFSNADTSGAKAQSVSVRIIQDSTGGWVLTLPPEVKGVVDIALDKNLETIVTFITFDGVTWYATTEYKGILVLGVGSVPDTYWGWPLTDLFAGFSSNHDGVAFVDGDAVFSANQVLYKMNGLSNTIQLQSIPGTGSWQRQGLAYDGEFLWSGTDRAVIKYDATTLTQLAIFDLYQMSVVGGVGWNGEHLVVTDAGTNKVYLYDTTPVLGDLPLIDSWTVIGTSMPAGVIVDKDGKMVIVDYANGNFCTYSTSTSDPGAPESSYIDAFNVGNWPARIGFGGIGYDGLNMWSPADATHYKIHNGIAEYAG